MLEEDLLDVTGEVLVDLLDAGRAVHVPHETVIASPLEPGLNELLPTHGIRGRDLESRSVLQQLQ